MDILTLGSREDWRVFRLGQVFRERKEKGSDKEFPPLSVTMKGIVPQLESAAKSDDGDNRKIVRVGDYVINSRSDRKGSGGISKYEGSVSLISIVLEPIGIAPRFAHFLLRSSAFQEEFYRWGHGIVADLWTTRYADMKNIRLRLPDLSTQCQIADFLDRETTRIDSLIEKKERLAELLEYRAKNALRIAVSGGVTVSPSTNEDWLNDISPPWKLIPLKHITTALGGATPSKDREEYWEGNIPWVSPKDMKSDVIYDVPDHVFESAIAESALSRVPAGAVLIVVRGMILARTIPVCRLGNDGTINQDMKALLPNIEILSGEYLQRMLQGFDDVLMSLVEEAAHGTKKLRSDRLFNMKFPIPDKATQNRVLRDYEAVRTSSMLLRERMATSVNRLKEYRSALITAAVTGQIDVKAYHKRDKTDRTLDRIEAEMSS
ncbi:MAG: restriction endonuclease subunit S [Parvibaculum sp.]|uniref:restriction endonuclease subunit S n=1 Tax=Parvibaculum sp. TaxID=2024848 RepID=UPI00391C0230